MTLGSEIRSPLARHDAEGAEARSQAPGAWTREVRRAVDEELARVFATKRALVAELGAERTVLVEAIASLTMRGGKRVRPCVVHAAHRAVCARPLRPGSHELERLRRLSAGLELMQTYLLVHDDWMDQDDERRGGPSVHVALRRIAGQAHVGDALAILAGDLASAYAWELVTAVALELAADPALAPAGAGLLESFSRTHQEVVLGQELDLLASSDVSRMQKLKTGSYTVEGPLRLGALLGGARPGQLERLERFGAPLGEAFQIRDDLLGAFGDPARTGKPWGSDLRSGKRTSLVRECERAALPEERAQLASVLGRGDASEAELAAALGMLERAGVRDRVEQRLVILLDASRAALDAEGPPGSALEPEGARMLRELVELLASRES
jgi:geranylgeranyl diphosphate synthase type I